MKKDAMKKAASEKVTVDFQKTFDALDKVTSSGFEADKYTKALIESSGDKVSAIKDASEAAEGLPGA